MGFEFEERKSLRFADLFKIEETRDHTNSSATMRRSPSSNDSSACDSSSSGFTTPFDSELGDQGDFAAELSRQMAEFMLHEEDEDEEQTNSVVHSESLRGLQYGSNSYHSVLDNHATRIPPVKLRKQYSPVGVSRERRVEATELTRRIKTQNYNYVGRYAGGDSKGNTGSGMQAIFINQPGLRNGSSGGTGVFLPQVCSHPARPPRLDRPAHPVQKKNKPGLSTVLIPRRVLEALELHFTRLSYSTSPSSLTNPPPSSHLTSPIDGWKGSKMDRNAYIKMELEPAKKVDEMQTLPQEWTY